MVRMVTSSNCKAAAISGKPRRNHAGVQGYALSSTLVRIVLPIIMYRVFFFSFLLYFSLLCCVRSFTVSCKKLIAKQNWNCSSSFHIVKSMS
uniref:Uncharacterized protein n=1 Tax=Oryza brachyantha TaxID=4533 RepID=J3L2B0_ORYBR